MSSKLTEKDLEQIFIANRRRRKGIPIKTFFKFLLLFAAIFVITFSVLNFSAIKQKIVFWYQDEFGSALKNQLSVAVQRAKNNSATNDFPNISDNSLFIER